MALALSNIKVNRDLRIKERILKAVATANYATGGDTVNLTSIANPTFAGDVNFGFPGKIDDYEVVQSAGGYSAELIPGATLATWKLKVFSAPGVELAAGAYPAAITGDFFVLRFAGAKATI